jgi:RNA polymerase primary sigma factor
MIPDALNTESVLVDAKSMKIPDSETSEQRWLEIEPAVDELEREEPVQVFFEPDEQETGDDPIRAYLREIGRVTLLTAQDEKSTARRIEMGKRISGVKREFEKQGKSASASQILLQIPRDNYRCEI